MSDLYPVFLRLQNRRALVVGGGTMAALRTRQLLAAGAAVTVISPTVNASLDELAEAGRIELIDRPFARSDVSKGYFIVIGATGDPATEVALAKEAERLGLLYNVVDDVEHSNFYTPALVERGDLKIAISTNGLSPVLARQLRQEIEAAIPSVTGEWIKQLGQLRQRLKFEIPVDFETRKQIIQEVIEKTIQR
ncbi:MAG: bifunctional precorrin-2 dehydrogenase/sirohydrochlorin ferrochelatase [Acidobacteriia bacterium]|nr:bifunctional precorrin-2 dehydrogenase/sirohydrochlorin ferrochelatase [Terriglobia bacterium]